MMSRPRGHGIVAGGAVAAGAGTLPGEATVLARLRAGGESRFIRAAEVRRQVEAALQELPYRQRAVMTLRDVEGCDAGEVCSVLGISAGNQRVLLHRARAAVRARLEDYFHGAGRETGAV